MTKYYKGRQFWNEDHTEGYELTEDCIPNTPCRADQFKALGKATPADEYRNKPMPPWLIRQVFGV